MGLKRDHGKLCASLGIPVLTFGFLLKWQSVRFEEHIKMPCKVETIKECCGDEIGQTKMGPHQGPWLQVLGEMVMAIYLSVYLYILPYAFADILCREGGGGQAKHLGLYRNLTTVYPGSESLCQWEQQ